MELTRCVATESPESCRTNLEITCYGKHISYRFWSGERKNKIVIQPNEENKIVATTVEQSWIEYFREVLQNIRGLLLRFVENVKYYLDYTRNILPRPLAVVNYNQNTTNVEINVYYEIV